MTRRVPTWLYVLVGIIGFWLILPTFIIFPLSLTDKASYVFPPTGWSLRWYESLFEDGQWMGAIGASLRVAVITLIVTALLGTAAALGTARLRSSARLGVSAMILAPAIVPSIVLAVAAYSLFLRFGLIGTHIGFAVVHIVLGLPLMFVSVSSSVAMFDNRLELAAASLGAKRMTTLRTVIFPAIVPGIVGGAGLVLVISLDEAVVSSFVSSARLITLPVKMFNSIIHDTDPRIAVISSLVLVFVVAAAVVWVVRARRIGSFSLPGLSGGVKATSSTEGN